LDDVTALVTFAAVPGVVLVTFTLIVQLVLAAIDATVNDTLVLPAVTVFGVIVPHVFASAASASVIPFGNTSLKLTFVNAVAVFGFPSVNVSDVGLPVDIDAAPNAFWIVGAPTIVTVAVLLGSPGPLSFDVIGPVVLFFSPGVVPITLTAIWHA